MAQNPRSSKKQFAMEKCPSHTVPQLPSFPSWSPLFLVHVVGTF